MSDPRWLPLCDRADVPPAARELSQVRSRGGTAVIPTETYYGLAADPFDADAVARVFELKHRPADRPLPVLCADWDQVEQLVRIADRDRVRLSRTWPAPLTVVAASRVRTAASPGGTLAVRIPRHRLLRALLYLVGPMTATSANRSGDPPPVTAEEATTSLVGTPDLVLDQGACPGGAPSTLVDLTGGEPVVLRQGELDWEGPSRWPGESLHGH